MTFKPICTAIFQRNTPMCQMSTIMLIQWRRFCEDGYKEDRVENMDDIIVNDEYNEDSDN